MNYQMHEMKLVELLGNGQGEYECPDCGYRVLVKWVKGYPRRRIIVDGDSEAAHAYNIHESEDLAIRLLAHAPTETAKKAEEPEDDPGPSAYDDFIDTLFD